MDNNLAIVQDYLTPSSDVSKTGKPKKSILSSIVDICNIDAFDLDAYPCYADLKSGGYTLLNNTPKIRNYLDRTADGITALWPVRDSFVYCFPPLFDRVLNRDTKEIYSIFSKVFKVPLEISPKLYTIQHTVFLKAVLEYHINNNTSAILFNQNYTSVGIFSECMKLAKSYCNIKVYRPKKSISMITLLGLQTKATARYYDLYVIGNTDNLKEENYFWSSLV